MLPENFTEFIDDLAFQVKNNIIPMSRIDDAVRRILRVKFIMGLFENPIADLSLANQVGSKVNISTSIVITPSVLFFSLSHFDITLFRKIRNCRCFFLYGFQTLLFPSLSSLLFL